MNRLFKYAMFFTAFIPLWITILFLDIMSITDETNNYIGSEVVGIGCIAIGLFLSAIIIFCSMRGVRSQNYTKYKILSAEQEKGITSEFLLSYILPLFAFDFTRWVSVFEFLIYFVILAFLCVRNNNVYANLLKENRLLNLAGKLAKAEAARAKSGWPPACAGILHQPKRPAKK